MSTKVHLVEPGFIPDDLNFCHFVCYGARNGGEGGLVGFGERIGIPEEVLQELADKANREFAIVTHPKYPITMLPYSLVQGENRENAFPPVAIIEAMLEIWTMRLRERDVVMVISNMWNPDITAFHQKLLNGNYTKHGEAKGYQIPGCWDLYVWTM